MNNEVSIYRYSDVAQYLRDIWQHKSSTNPAFSIRSWARTIGLQAHAPLHLMIAGKRGIPSKHIPALVKSLGLAPKEALYFETLVELARARSSESRTHYLERLRRLSPKATSALLPAELESFHALEDPLHMVILEAAELEDFEAIPSWLRARLKIDALPARVRDCLSRLEQQGLLKRDDAGRLVKTHRQLSTRQDVADLAVQAYHRNVLELGIESTREPVSERELGAYAFAIRKDKIPEIKRLVRELTRKIMEATEAEPGHGEEVAFVCTQFFQVTGRHAATKQGRHRSTSTPTSPSSRKPQGA